ALVGTREETTPWTPARDRLPLGDGTLRLTDDLLPPLDNIVTHLAIATSHPEFLVATWRRSWDESTATRVLLHDLSTAPLVVHAPDAGPLDPQIAESHTEPGFIVWHADRAALLKFLGESPLR